MDSVVKLVGVLALVAAFCLSTFGAAENLLVNPSFEEGVESPEGWRPWPAQAAGVHFRWDDGRAHSGARSVCVEAGQQGFGMWRQLVPVQEDTVYVLAGYVGFEGIAPPGHCNLQLVFRDGSGRIVERVDFLAHSGTRELAYDFPREVMVRVPSGAVRCEVNLFLQGPGAAWFDDIVFGPAPTGNIAGTVTSGGRPLSGVRVYIWGDPWGAPYEAVTDGQGRYLIEEVPVAGPRYLLLAQTEGYRTCPVGDVAVLAGQVTPVDFELEPGQDPTDDLRVKFGSLALRKWTPPAPIPKEAVVAPELYPDSVLPFLQPDEYIQSDHPAVRELAQGILAGLSPEERGNAYAVAWAVYEWMSVNIEHDSVLDEIAGGMDNPATRDVTSGIWQTISGRGWCWGRNFYDWAYTPAELLAERGGICVEHSWLAAALLRALGIPARAAVGANQIWVQLPSGEGWWAGFSTTQGRAAYRAQGRLGPGFGGLDWPVFYSVLSRPVLHEDWSLERPGMWRERHPWQEGYQGTPAGLERAMAALERFSETGEAPQGDPPRERGREYYFIHYSDVTINLCNVGDQRRLDVRFPIVSDSPVQTFTGEVAYWTNHPECVVRTWIEEIENPPAEGVERWFHIEFDLTPLLGG